MIYNLTLTCDKGRVPDEHYKLYFAEDKAGTDVYDIFCALEEVLKQKFSAFTIHIEEESNEDVITFEDYM